MHSVLPLKPGVTKVYVDDVVVKTTEEDQLIADLTETFTNLREFQRKLNMTKCVSSVYPPYCS
jgi:hypothetical protein